MGRIRNIIIIFKDNYSKLTCSLAWWHFIYPWFKKCHQTHSRYAPLYNRYPHHTCVTSISQSTLDFLTSLMKSCVLLWWPQDSFLGYSEEVRGIAKSDQSSKAKKKRKKKIRIKEKRESQDSQSPWNWRRFQSEQNWTSEEKSFLNLFLSLKLIDQNF